MTLSDEIVQARTSAGLSQEGLARLARVCTQTISKIERGVCDPRTSTLDRIRSALADARRSPVRATGNQAATSKRTERLGSGG